MLSPEFYTQAFRSYEKDHAVEEYVAYDWRAWPLLRTPLSKGIYKDPNGVLEESEKKRRANLSLPKKFFEKSGKASDIIKKRFFNRCQGEHPYQNRCDVVILAFSNRTVAFEEDYYHYLADPLVEEFSKRGIRAVVWEFGTPSLPRKVPHAFCSARLKFDSLLASRNFKNKTIESPPEWFSEFSDWSLNTLERRFTWNGVANRLRSVQTNSAVFEKWLKRSGCRFLLTDVWYSPEGMAAILAASRLGIESADLQHGIQGKAHYAYAYWSRIPKAGYEIMPKNFWVWGQSDMDMLKETSQGFFDEKSIVKGGNLWINKWKDPQGESFLLEIEKCKSLIKGYGKVILVTLQPSTEWRVDVKTMIKNGPDDWFWLIRRHRGMEETEAAITAELREFDRGRVNVQDASNLALHALCKVSDCHVTWSSTCAFEALAFGAPSVILHEFGRDFFKDYIDSGVMLAPNSPEDICASIKESFSISPEDCLDKSQLAFFSEETTSRAIDALVEKHF